MNIRIENWNGHDIRFVERSYGDWWAIAVDACKALNLRNATMAVRRLDAEDKALINIEGINRNSEKVNIVSEFGIYDLINASRKTEAKSFKRWVKQILKNLRHASGLEGFQVFRMLDKDHQKEAMSKLSGNLVQPARVDFIKANTIANKAVSSMYGMPKMLKKDHMSPDMLVKRQQVLDDTVNLMSVVNKFGLEVSVSETIYGKYIQ